MVPRCISRTQRAKARLSDTDTVTKTDMPAFKWQRLRLPALVVVLAYGKLWGVPIALLGVNIAINVSFLTVRLIGGTPFEQHSHPFVGKLLKGLHASPITNIAIMRLVFWTAPGLNYLLALSAVKPQQHFLGSLLGTIIPVTGMVYFTDWLMLKIFQ